MSFGMAPLFSITITCYNYARFMPRCLEAIKRQSFKDYEVILCDDCSTDDTVAVVNKFIEDNPGMDITLLVNENNLGVLGTRNRLLDNSKGKYIMFCDSDDWMDDNCLEVLARYAQDDPDRIIAQFRDVDQDGKVVQVQDLPANPNKWICGVHHGSVYKRQIFTDHNIKFECKYPDDVYINVLFHKYCGKVSFAHETIFNWYVHTDSQSRTPKADSPWIGHRLLESASSYIVPVMNDLGDERDYLELMYIKIYCLSIYSVQGLPLKILLSEYDQCRKIMRQNDPDYLTNRFLKRSSESPMRKYATKIVRMTALFEKMHLIKPALIGYFLVSKVHYFDL